MKSTPLTGTPLTGTPHSLASEINDALLSGGALELEFSNTRRDPEATEPIRCSITKHHRVYPDLKPMLESPNTVVIHDNKLADLFETLLADSLERGGLVIAATAPGLLVVGFRQHNLFVALRGPLN